MPNANDNLKPAGIVTVLTGVITGLLRLIPHPWNCTPVGALGLFAGGRLPWWLALPLPLALMGITDYLLFITTGAAPYDPWVYGSVVVYVLLGRLLTGTRSVWRIAAVTVLGSVAFFLITNFGAWYQDIHLPHSVYASNVSGLIACYVAGLEFYRATLIGDLVFAMCSFGAFEWLTRRAAAPVPVPEEARV